MLEKHHLSEALFEEVNTHLASLQLLIKRGSIVDATIIHAPSSTKNRQNTRDPDMKATRKGNQCYFGMKAHIGVDAQTGLVHSLVGTSANVADVTQVHHLLHGQEEIVHGNVGYNRRDATPRTSTSRGHLAHPPTEGIGLARAGAAGMGKTSASAKSQRENPG